jgi:uncharacterized protein YndB with AHSA1/START domain
MGADKATYEVTRESTIAAPRAAVFDLLVDFHRWPEWSPWEDIDPDLRRSYSGSSSGVGAVYEWEGNRKAGQGRMEIVAAEPPARLEIALRFIKPFKSDTTTTFVLDEREGATHVTWRLVGPKTFATRVMGVFMSMDKMVGRDFERGLARLSAAAQPAR